MKRRTRPCAWQPAQTSQDPVPRAGLGVQREVEGIEGVSTGYGNLAAVQFLRDSRGSSGGAPSSGRDDPVLGHGGGQGGGDGDPGTEAVGAYTRSTGVGQPVQGKALHLNVGTSEVPRRAERGLAGPAGSLPHGDAIQRSFGRHDLGGVQAHVGGEAQRASAAIGAQAYTMGNDVAFGSTPDLHTAAHEAAHVVQQRAGVSLANAVGTPGDTYERRADAVADRVVAGTGAEDLLGAPGPGAGAGAVQMTTVEVGVESYDIRIGLVTPPEDTGEVTVGGRQGVILENMGGSGVVEPDDLARELDLDPGTLVRANDQNATCLEYLAADPREDASVIAHVQGWIDAQDSGTCAAGVCTRDDAAIFDFARRFRERFAPILDVMPRSERDLYDLFTETQHRLLEQFLRDRQVPEGLFNGTEIGSATAQQRILMSAEILRSGSASQFRGNRTSDTGTLSAGSCGDWARTVYEYAAAAPTGGRERFMHGGIEHPGIRTGSAVEGEVFSRSTRGPSRSSGDEFVGGTSEARRGRLTAPLATRVVDQSEIQGLEPGDWVILYNDNPAPAGQHSVIFDGWIEEPREHDGERIPGFWGLARVYEQTDQEQGGRNDREIRLGTELYPPDTNFGEANSAAYRVVPVTRVDRVSEQTGLTSEGRSEVIMTEERRRIERERARGRGGH